MKKEVPAWSLGVMGILTVVIVILAWNMTFNMVTFDEYAELALEYTDSTKQYVSSVGDFILLLDCYRNAKPTCDTLIEKGGNVTVFTLGSGW